MKKSCMIMACVTLSLIGYSQTHQSHVQKAFNDPQRKVNAGKADVIIIDKKKIVDSTIFDNNAPEAVKDNTVITSTKAKKCGSKAGKKAKKVSPTK